MLLAGVKAKLITLITLESIVHQEDDYLHHSSDNSIRNFTEYITPQDDIIAHYIHSQFQQENKTISFKFAE